MATKLRPVVIYGANGTSRRTHPLKPTMKTNELTKDQVEEAISIAAPFSRSNPPNHINILTDAAREWLEMRDARLLASGIIEANRNLTSDPKYFKVARQLVESGELVPYSHMDRIEYENTPERLQYYFDCQTAGLSHKIKRIHKMLCENPTP